MRLSDYMTLALTKIRTRKFRSILTMISATVLLVGMLTGSFALAGTKKSIEDAVPEGFKGKHISAELPLYEDSFYIDDGPANIEPSEPDFSKSFSEFTERAKSAGAVNAYRQVALDGLIAIESMPDLCDDDSDYGRSCSSISIRSDRLFGYSSDKNTVVADGAVPANISARFAQEITDNQYADGDSSEQKLQKSQNAAHEALGKTYQVKYQYYDANTAQIDHSESDDHEMQSIDMEITIVGVMPDESSVKSAAGIFIDGNQPGVILPESQLPRQIIEKNQLSMYQQPLLLAEFDSSDQLQSYVESGCQDTECWREGNKKPEIQYFTDYNLALDAQAGEIWSMLRWLVGIAAIGTGISVMSTTSKVVFDSRREIGVFRAIGARRMQVMIVYVTYICILMLMALAISLVISWTITMLINAKFASGVSTEIALIKGSSEASGHFSFFGVDLLQVLLIGLFAVGVGIIGAIIPVVGTLRRDTQRYLRSE